jgi:hypothetical protein
MSKKDLLMKSFFILFTFVNILLGSITFSQVENVQLHHSVYTFLKEMKVKGIISFIREDDPVISRFEVKDLLEKIAAQVSELSNTEKKLLQKYRLEFSDSIDPDTATQLFNPQNNLFSDLDQMFTDKVKYLFAYQEAYNNIYMEWLGHFYHAQKFLPENNVNSNLYDIGFRIRGTVFNHLGYNLTVFKGGVSGNKSIAEVIEPRLLTSFKWIEDSENIGNYDSYFTDAKYAHCTAAWQGGYNFGLWIWK